MTDDAAKPASGQDGAASKRATLTDRLVALAHTRKALAGLLALEVAETTFVPLPYEAAFLAMCAAARDRIWLFVLITVLGSAIAGAIMYRLGADLADPIAARLGVEAALAEYSARFAERGASFIFLGGATPAPSYLINLAAGASGYPFWSFLAIFSASRFVRFAILGALVYFLGDDIARLWKRLPRRLRRVLVVLILAALAYWFVSGFTG
ncbi:MAG: VTT domain-containing protein [Pseudomonadota bacterium]